MDTVERRRSKRHSSARHWTTDTVSLDNSDDPLTGNWYQKSNQTEKMDEDPISGLTQEEIDEYKEAFAMFDINGDGG